MTEAQSNDLLQQCQRYFPGLAWENYSGGVSCTAKVPSIIFDQALVVYDNGDGDFEVSIQTNLEGMRLSKRLWVGADAIAQAAERWREFSAEAMAVVGPLPPPKTSPEIQRQSDFATIAYQLEGDRRKAQGLPSDREAQGWAGAEAMAWAEDNPG
jgi:hypothetical protein